MEEAELEGLVNLEELWLGKNKIEKIEGLSKVRGISIRIAGQIHYLTPSNN